MIKKKVYSVSEQCVHEDEPSIKDKLSFFLFFFKWHNTKVILIWFSREQFKTCLFQQKTAGHTKMIVWSIQN